MGPPDPNDDAGTIRLSGSLYVPSLNIESWTIGVVSLPGLSISAPNPADPMMRPLVKGSAASTFVPDFEDPEQDLLTPRTGTSEILSIDRTTNGTKRAYRPFADGKVILPGGKSKKLSAAKFASLKRYVDSTGILDAGEIGYPDRATNSVRLITPSGLSSSDRLDSQRDPDRVAFRAVSDHIIALMGAPSLVKWRVMGPFSP